MPNAKKKSTGLTLSPKEAKCLKALLEYVACDEAEHDDGSKNHIWASIKPLYDKVHGPGSAGALQSDVRGEE